MCPHGFSWALLHAFAALMLFCGAGTHLFVQANKVGSVTFFEGRPGTYLRRVSYDTLQERTFSSEDVSATVAVLLGLSPPSSISQESASKLNDLLTPDPFHRPQGVLVLTVKQVETGEIIGFSSAPYRQLAPENGQALLAIPDDIGVSLLNSSFNEELESTDVDLQLHELASFLGGSFESGTDLLKGELTVHTQNDDVLSLDLSKKADRMLALEVVAMFQSIKESVAAQDHHNKQLPRGLFFGTIASTEILYKDFDGSITAEQASHLLLLFARKMFNYINSAYNGSLVGVILNAEEDILDLKITMGPSRLLLLAASSTTDTATVAAALTEKIITYTTALILLVALIIGTCFLFKMPVTRDTLLYSGVKLD